ncbi:unnamed protein product [Gongylonema pulchrum]|uniref:CTNNB1_binding domain-containing protein n=1 Tax=Gongylonema pulchrum TaxID=637853 RepID=A0A183EL97_9BILA|nr:unnamed protein product [Gongylonema pulchrum]
MNDKKNQHIEVKTDQGEREICDGPLEAYDNGSPGSDSSTVVTLNSEVTELDDCSEGNQPKAAENEKIKTPSAKFQQGAAKLSGWPVSLY